MAINPTQNGISPISGLPYNPNHTAEERAARDNAWQKIMQERKLIKKGINTAYNPDVTSFTESQHYAPGTPGYEKGKSKYDKEGDVFTPVTSFDDLQQRRYEAQPWWDTVGNGVAKFMGRTATSFVDGVLGGLVGIGAAAMTGDMSKLWDNPFTNAMADVDKWFDENFVNYQSLKQKQNSENGEWWNNLDSLNMWMDDVLTNVGFTVGMIGSAMVTGGLGGAAVKGLRGATASAARAATRSGNNLMRDMFTFVNRATNKVGQPVSKFITIANSSMGEASLEGLNTKREMVEEETGRINDAIDQSIIADPQVQQLEAAYQQQSAYLDQQFGYDRSNPMYQQYKQQLDSQYQQQRTQLTAQYENQRKAAMEQLNENATKAGNAVVGLNLAILIPSNFNLAGRFVDKAFRSAERSAGKSWAVRNGEIGMRNAFGQRNITGNAAEGYGSRSFLGNYAKRMGSTAFSEGIYEEMGQSTASKGAKKYHAYADADNYWRARLDPDSVDLVADGSHDFLGALGYGLKETYGSADGWKEGFIGGITGMLFGGSEVRDEWRNTMFAKRAVKDLNKQLQSDKLPNLLQHLVAQGFHEQNKIRLAEEGNQNDWKTEDDKAMFSLISSFARAGRMDDLYAMIDEHAMNMSDEEIQSIIDGSVKEVTPEMQREDMRQAAHDSLKESLAQHLKDGVSNEDLTAAREQLNSARQAEQEAREQAASVLGDIATDPSKKTTLRKYASHARDARGNAARQVRAAAQATERAERAYRQMLNDTSSIDAVEKTFDDYNRAMSSADESTPQSYWRGPASLVDEDGNRASIADARKSIEHNTKRVRESVDAYKEAVEEINRKSRGAFSKDQEDYLAYLYFLGGTHIKRAEELIRKWRDVLPSTISIRHDNPKRIADRYGIPESDVVADPNKEGWLRVSTKNFTDEQFGRFMLNDFVNNTDVGVYDSEDNYLEEDTEEMRSSIYQEAFNRLQELSETTGKRSKIDAEQFKRDFEDVEKCYEKAKEFEREFEKARNNPEGILTAKERAIRWLLNTYQSLRDKFRSRELTDEELAQLDDDGLKRLDQYRFDKETLRRILRGVENFLDDQLGDVAEKVKTALEAQLNKHGILVDDVLSIKTQKKILDRIKQILKENLDALRNGEKIGNKVEDVEASEVPAMQVESDNPFDIDPSEVLAGIMAELDEDEAKAAEELRKKLEEASKDGKITIDGIKTDAANLYDVVMKRYIASVIKRMQNKNWQRNFINVYNRFIDSIKDYYNKLRESVKKTTGVDPSSSFEKISSYASNLLHKISEQDLVKIDELKDIIKKKLDALEQKGEAASKVAKALRQLLKTINDQVTAWMNRKKKDTDSVKYPPAPEEAAAAANHVQPTLAQDDSDVAAGTSDTAHHQTPSFSIEMEAADKDATAAMQIRFDDSTVGKDIWQSVTGEFARRSGFTYEPYHVIVKRFLDNLPKTAKDSDEHSIPELGDKVPPHTVEWWRRSQKRSEFVHNKLTQARTFGHIDAGNVHVGSKIGFQIFHDPEVGLVVFLTHNGKIIADLNHPDFAKNVTGLKEIYDVFKAEYEASDTPDKTEKGVTSKWTTTCNNVFAGFQKYNNKEDDGTIPTNTVESIAGDTHVSFAVNKSNTITDSHFDGDTVVFGKGSVGQPFVLLDTPGQNGLTRKRAIPVTTMRFGNTGIEAKVMAAAGKKAMSTPNPEDYLRKFLIDFLNCRNVFVTRENVKLNVGTDKEESTTALKIDIVTRDMDITSNEPVRVTAYYYQSTGTIKILTNNLRANVSHALLNPDITRTTSYEQVAAVDSSLPQTYTEFLKKICHTKLADVKTHNSWITVNPLSIDGEGNVNEIPVAPVKKQTVFNSSGNADVTLRDPFTGESYKITFKKGSGGVPKIASIRFSNNGSPLVYTNLTQVNKSRLLDVIARAVMIGTEANWGDSARFNIDGLVYEFGTSIKNHAIEHPKLVENATDHAAIDKEVNDAVGLLFPEYGSISLDVLAERYFYPGTLSTSPELQETLRKIIEAKRAGKNSFEGIDYVDKARLVNALRPVSRDESNKQALTRKIIKHLRSHGINVYEDGAKGQEHINVIMGLLRDGKEAEAALYSEQNGISFFVTPDGKTVYGFAGKDGIWLDPNLINPETLIHEYTHLWAYMLRNSNNPQHKKMWNSLVADLRDNHKDMWEEVKRNYPWLKSDDKIADEVFAWLSGEAGAEKIADVLSKVEGDADKAMQSLRRIYKKFIDYIKQLLGIKANAQTMSELVFADMMSNNPLMGFDAIADAYTAEPEVVKPSPEEQGAGGSDVPGTYKLSELTSADDVEEVLTDNGYRIEDGVVYLDGKTVDDLNDIGVYVNDDSGFSFQISMTKPQQTPEGLSSDYTSNVQMKFNSNPSFTGVSQALDRLETAMLRKRIGTEDFLLAATTMLTEEQRNKLWNIVNSRLGSTSKPNIVATIQTMFESYLRNDMSDIPSELVDIFSVLQSSIDIAVNNKSAIESIDMAASSGTVESTSVGTPADPLYNLSNAEVRLSHLDYIDRLSSQDEQLLEMAGYSKEVYHALPESGKEQVRKCVL